MRPLSSLTRCVPAALLLPAVLVAGACSSASNPAGPSDVVVSATSGSGSTPRTSGGGSATEGTTPGTVRSSRPGTTLDGSSGDTRRPGSVPPASAGSAGSACGLVAREDLADAGVPGQIGEGTDATGSFSLDSANSAGSACEFMISDGGYTGNLIVIVAPGGGRELYTSAQDSFAEETLELPDIGDAAVYQSGKPEADGSYEQTVFVLVGDTVVGVNTPASKVVDRQMLTKIAGTIAGRLA